MQEKDCFGFIPSHATCKYGEFLFTQICYFLILPTFFSPKPVLTEQSKFSFFFEKKTLYLYIELTGLIF